MKYDLTNINTVKKLLSAHDFSFSKALGQNFITDPEVCPRMAELSGTTKEDGVIEIGPGIGALTVELAQRSEKTVALELDKRLLPVLAKTLSEHGNVFVENADALKTDFAALAEKYFAKGQKLRVCANLPYYITSPVIMKLLESGTLFESITVMVQKEAADRLCAEPGERECGAVTAAVRYYATPEILFEVKSSSFTPPPKVDSAVIKLTPRQSPPEYIKDRDAFFKTVKAAFLHRRKTAANGLSSELGLPKSAVISALEKCGLPPAVRAEEISMEKMAELSEALKSAKG